MRKIHVHADHELECLRKTIDTKLSSNQNADREIEIYKAWLKDPDFAKADKRNIQGRVYKALKNG